MQKATVDRAEHINGPLSKGEKVAPWVLGNSFNFAQDVLAVRAQEMPDAIAIAGIAPNGEVDRWSFSRVATASGRLAAAMTASGLVKGDRVIIFMPRIPLWQVALSACMHIGVIPVPCVTQITSPELAYRAKQCGARGAITSSEFFDRFEGFERDLIFKAARSGNDVWQDLNQLIATPQPIPSFAAMPANTPALIYFTSGSSGMPKAVVHTARGISVRGRQPWWELGMKPGDVIWNGSDTGWTRASGCLLFGAWHYGATALIVEAMLSPSERLRIIDDMGVNFYCAVSTELRQIMARAEPRPLPKLRWTHSAGEAMTADLADSWQAFSGAPLVVGYGQTETPSATLTNPNRPALNGMIGRPMLGNNLAILDADGLQVAAGAEGEIAFDAEDPGLLAGFYTETGIVPSPRRGKWHMTGDMGYQTEDGEIFFVGRADDIISSSGYRIGPTEVENALARHPTVADCAVVASPDAERGEIVKAFVLLRSDFTGSPELARELQEFTKQSVAPYKYPRAVAFVESLPRTATGKVSRRQLRETEFSQQS